MRWMQENPIMLQKILPYFITNNPETEWEPVVSGEVRNLPPLDILKH
jgi:hypothetical protein